MKAERIYYFPPEPETGFAGVYIDLDSLVSVRPDNDRSRLALDFQLRSDPVIISNHYDAEAFQKVVTDFLAAWKAYLTVVQ